MLEKRITICQGVTMGRVCGWTVGLAREDRIFSMTQDDELALLLPAEMLPDLVRGLSEAARRIGARYPVPFYQNFEPEFPKPHRELGEKFKLFPD